MPFQFSKHYTRDEARALLPDIRQWLDQLNEQRRQLEKLDERLSRLLGLGDDLGGDLVNRWVQCLATIKALLLHFQTREIQIKDLDRGLVDFPAFIGGKEVFLCWEKDEDDIEYWHELHTGYAGREKLE